MPLNCTVGEFAARGGIVVCYCKHCRRVGNCSARTIAERIGRTKFLNRIHFRCSRCWESAWRLRAYIPAHR